MEIIYGCELQQLPGHNINRLVIIQTSFMKNFTKIYLVLFLIASEITHSQIGLGTKNPDASAILDVSSSTQGFLLPRLHLNEQKNMVLPANGLLLYNLDTNALEVNAGTPLLPIWISVTGPTGNGVITTSGVGLENIATGINAIAFGGTFNVSSSLNSSAMGGTYNLANNINASTLGGFSNTASGVNSSVIGGTKNLAYDLNSSVLGGTINEAKGINSSIIGGTTNVSFGMNSSVIGGTTNYSFGINSSVIGGSSNTSNGINSGVVFGQDNTANNLTSSILGGSLNKANGINSSLVGGTVNEAFGLNSAVLGGTTNIAFGINSGIVGGTTNYAFGINAAVLGGSTNTATGDYSVAIGGATNLSVGSHSFVCGFGNHAASYGEFAAGINGTKYTAGSLTAHVATDRVFNIGNGLSASARSDAMTILKNGLAFLPSSTVNMIEIAGIKAITTKEYTDATYAKFKNTPPASSSAAGTVGEIRFTATYTYTCIAPNQWVRSAVETF